MPIPRVKRGSWKKERERNRDGRWRKKRSDAGKRRLSREERQIKYGFAYVLTKGEKGG